jgi:type I restriction enzyme S subunit
MANGEGRLPDGWEWTTVEDLSQSIQYGYTESASIEPVGPKFLRITDIQNGKVNWETVPYCVCLDNEVGRYLLESGDIVFARTGATTGKSFLITNPPRAVFASYLIRLRLQQEVNKKYFSYFLDSPDYWSQIMQVRKGSAQPGVNAAILAKLKVPIAPLPEQERIVAKIEELFTQLEAGTSALAKVQAGLDQYQKSILNAAIFGNLIEQREAERSASELLEDILEFRTSKPAKNKNPLLPDFGDISSIPSLPSKWVWSTLDQLTWSVRDGMHFSPEYVTDGIPFITGGNVRPTGVNFEKAKRISRELHDKLIRFKPDMGDILYTKGGTTGIARVNTYDIEFNVWVHVAVLKLCEGVEPFYIQHALNSPFCYQQSQKYTHGVGNQDLGLTRMIKILIPLPPLEEQRRIVAEVERRLSVARQVEGSVEAALVRASRLRQAVLRSAFEGRL